MRLLNALTAKGTDILKVFAFVGRDASNVQETIQPLTIHAERHPKMLNVRGQSSSPLQRLYGLRICEGIFYREKWNHKYELNLQIYKLDMSNQAYMKYMEKIGAIFNSLATLVTRIT